MSTSNSMAAEGVATRHSKLCRSGDGGRCGCKPTYQANVWHNAEDRRIRKSFKSLTAAKAWRRDALTAIEHGTMNPHTSKTLAECAEEFIAGAKSGAIRSNRRQPYKPSSIRGYERCLRLRVLPAFGHLRVSDIRKRDLQRFVDNMLAEGVEPATIVKTVDPLRAIFRRLHSREDININPTTNLDVPKGTGRRERIADPAEAAELLAALPASERALWATALYAGLRRSELRALRVSDLDLATGVIKVTRSWDDEEGEQEDGKTAAARRKVPVAGMLRDELDEHLLLTGRRGDDLVFGLTAEDAFVPSTVRSRALAAWEGRQPITLHEGRHTFASLMIAAGVNAKALSTYMGHASISITFDRYGHLMPGNEDEAAGLLDSYLVRAVSRDTGATMTLDSMRSSAVDSGAMPA